MSVSFIVDVPAERQLRIEPCLCAQMSPAWTAVHRGESHDFAPLRAHADPKCAQCGGTGAEPVEHDTRPCVNFCNGNARLIAQAMGLDFGDGYGRADLPTFRRGVIRARNTRQPETLRAAESRGRFRAGAYTRADLMRALARLEALIADAERLGARAIIWG